MAVSESTWLTQAAYDRLKAELEHLSTTGRSEIAKRIEIARNEGDLKENGGYHAAKDEQGKMEARIRQLTEMLENAIVGVAAEDDGTVRQGSLVTAEIFGDTEKFVVGSREIIEDSDVEAYSEQSPIGKAVIGATAGDTVEYTTPTGKTVKVKIISVSTYEG